QPQLDGIVRRSRHDDLCAAPLEKLAHLFADGQHRLCLIEPCRTGGADWWMAGIDGDREATQRIAGVDRRTAPNAEHEVAVFPENEVAVELLSQRDVELRAIVEHLL